MYEDVKKAMMVVLGHGSLPLSFLEMELEEFHI
jgi:hypothetical protein